MQASQLYGTRLICSVLQRVAACGSVLQRVAVRNDIRIHGSIPIIRDMTHLQCVAVCCSVLQRIAVCCSVLQCVAVCCSVLQRVAVCCSVLQCAQKDRFSSKYHFSLVNDPYSKRALLQEIPSSLASPSIIETPSQPHKIGFMLQHILHVKSPFFYDTIQQALPSACSARSTSLLHIETHTYTFAHTYGVATISRLLKIIGLFCERAL